MGYDNPLQNEYEGFRQRAARTEADWCDNCHGYTHMPWCPSYQTASTGAVAFVDGTLRDAKHTTQLAPSSEQPASATGSEWRTVCMTGTSFDLRPCWTIEQDGQPLLATAYSEKVAHQIVNDHNQHQQCAAQLRFLGNRAEELSSLLAGMTTERDAAHELLRQFKQWLTMFDGRTAWPEWIAKIDAALNHAEQREGS